MRSPYRRPTRQYTCALCGDPIDGRCRRDCYGNMYDDLCGHRVQYNIQRHVRANPQLHGYVLQWPAFVQFVDPHRLGFRYMKVEYIPYPSKKPRKRRTKHCVTCGKTVTTVRRYSILGMECHRSGPQEKNDYQ